MQQIASQVRFATTRLATGPRVRYAEQGDPGGEPIVFLHGYTDSWWSFSRLLPLLAGERYHAYALDQRGHGDSERPESGYAPDDFAADVVAFLDAVGAPRATVVGHCLGGFVAARVAATYPERVARLVILNAAATPANAATLGLQEEIRALQDPVPAELVIEFQSGTVHVPVPEAFFEQVVAESLKLPARVWRSVLDGLLAADSGDHLGRIAAPTLILGGERDAIYPPENQQRLAAAIPGARVTIYPETGHTPHWERPERVAADLDAFVRVT
jgi:non-heme chloroperoxidase